MWLGRDMMPSSLPGFLEEKMDLRLKLLMDNFFDDDEDGGTVLVLRFDGPGLAGSATEGVTLPPK